MKIWITLVTAFALGLFSGCGGGNQIGNLLHETETVLEQTKEVLKSTEVQLAEARSHIEKLYADLARATAEMASARNRVDTLTTEKQALNEEVSALNDMIAQKENDILGLEADLASVTNERDRAEKELDLCLAQLQKGITTPRPSNPTRVRKQAPGTQEANTDPQEEAIIGKLKKWIIPELQFEEASLDDIIDFLVLTSRELDDTKEGINIISMIPGGRGSSGSAPITLSLRRVSMMDALRFITEIANLRCRIDKNVVIIEK